MLAVLAGVLLLVLAASYRYGAWSHGWAVMVLLPTSSLVLYLLARKLVAHQGEVVLLSDGQLTVNYSAERVEGAVCLPLLITDIGLLISAQTEHGKRHVLLMCDAVAPADYRQLSAMMHQLRRRYAGSIDSSL